MATIKKPICTLGIIGIFTFILFLVTAQAGQPIDCLICQDMTMKTIVETGDLIIMGTEGRAIVLDNTESKFFDNMTGHAVGLMKIEKGKVNGTYLTRYQDPSGDLYIVEASLVGTEGDWKCIYGTGKYKGISAAGKFYRVTKGKPVSPGTAQVCSKITGTYELEK